MSELYRICEECDGKGFIGQDMCAWCLASEGPLGLLPVTIDYEAATTKLVKLLRLMGFEPPVEMAKAMEVGAVGVVEAALGGNDDTTG